MSVRDECAPEARLWGPGPEVEGLLLRVLRALATAPTLSPEERAALAAAPLAALALAPRMGRPYGRRVLHGSPLGEVMLASWAAGERAAPHDHGGARGAVLVLAGDFEERRFSFDGEVLSPIASQLCGAGAVIRVSAGLIHDMHARAAGGLTLHFYVGEAGPARLYDVARRCTVLSRGGAWLPADEADAAVTFWSTP